MKVVFHRNFKKHYKRLPLKIQNSFHRRLIVLLKNPRSPELNNHSVDNVFPECRSINVTGDYRAIYRKEDVLYIFIKIGSHSDLYG